MGPRLFRGIRLARYELGLPGKRWRAPALTPIVAGIPFEVEGLRLLGSGSPLDAAILLRRGAAAFAGGHARGEMRCRLGEALALSEAEARQHARELFLALAEQARDGGLAPLLARVERALQSAAVHRSAPRKEARFGLTTANAALVAELLGP